MSAQSKDQTYQPTLFSDFPDEWDGMPEFIQEDLSPWHQINVRFRNQEDFNEFCKKMEQTITPKQKSLWFPFKANRIASKYIYIDEDES